jgi:hypothetical protein
MSVPTIINASTSGSRGPVLVTGRGPFEGLGVVFGGAVTSKKSAAKKAPAEAKAKSGRGRIVAMTLFTGALSGLLYLALYLFQNDIVQLADATRHGTRIDFIVPIIIALVFSLVHGSFTERFWGMLGLKPKHH